MDKQLSERMKATGTGGGAGAGDVPGVSNPAARKELAERYVKIPAKYAMQQTTPLIVDLQEGWNTHDFTLAD